MLEPPRPSTAPTASTPAKTEQQQEADDVPSALHHQPLEWSSIVRLEFVANNNSTNSALHISSWILEEWFDSGAFFQVLSENCPNLRELQVNCGLTKLCGFFAGEIVHGDDDGDGFDDEQESAFGFVAFGSAVQRRQRTSRKKKRSSSHDGEADAAAQRRWRSLRVLDLRKNAFRTLPERGLVDACPFLHELRLSGQFESLLPAKQIVRWTNACILGHLDIDNFAAHAMLEFTAAVSQSCLFVASVNTQPQLHPHWVGGMKELQQREDLVKDIVLQQSGGASNAESNARFFEFLRCAFSLCRVSVSGDDSKMHSFSAVPLNLRNSTFANLWYDLRCAEQTAWVPQRLNVADSFVAAPVFRRDEDDEQQHQDEDEEGIPAAGATSAFIDTRAAFADGDDGDGGSEEDPFAPSASSPSGLAMPADFVERLFAYVVDPTIVSPSSSFSSLPFLKSLPGFVSEFASPSSPGRKRNITGGLSSSTRVLTAGAVRPFSSGLGRRRLGTPPPPSSSASASPAASAAATPSRSVVDVSNTSTANASISAIVTPSSRSTPPPLAGGRRTPENSYVLNRAIGLNSSSRKPLFAVSVPNPSHFLHSLEYDDFNAGHDNTSHFDAAEREHETPSRQSVMAMREWHEEHDRRARAGSPPSHISGVFLVPGRSSPDVSVTRERVIDNLSAVSPVATVGNESRTSSAAIGGGDGQQPQRHVGSAKPLRRSITSAAADTLRGQYRVQDFVRNDNPRTGDPFSFTESSASAAAKAPAKSLAGIKYVVTEVLFDTGALIVEKARNLDAPPLRDGDDDDDDGDGDDGALLDNSRVSAEQRRVAKAPKRLLVMVRDLCRGTHAWLAPSSAALPPPLPPRSDVNTHNLAQIRQDFVPFSKFIQQRRREHGCVAPKLRLQAVLRDVESFCESVGSESAASSGGYYKHVAPISPRSAQQHFAYEKKLKRQQHDHCYLEQPMSPGELSQMAVPSLGISPTPGAAGGGENATSTRMRRRSPSPTGGSSSNHSSASRSKARERIGDYRERQNSAVAAEKQRQARAASSGEHGCSVSMKGMRRSASSKRKKQFLPLSVRSFFTSLDAPK